MKTAEYKRGLARGRRIRSEPGAADDACEAGTRGYWLRSMAADACRTDRRSYYSPRGSPDCERGYAAGARPVVAAIRRAKRCRRQRG
ncbi:MAG: hypothetical protein WC969_15535 [Elusimicrobiota bacterium]|jgi:hypothetical protein